MAGRVGTKLGSQFVDLDRQVAAMFLEIAEATRVATRMLSTGRGEPAAAEHHAGRDAGAFHQRVDRAIEEQFARYPPMGSEFRYLVTLLRVVPELERSADLVALIAARSSLSASLSPRLVDIVVDLGRMASAMWESAGEAWANVDPRAEARLDEADDEMDVLTSSLPAILAKENVPARAAIELTLVGRFYERLSDHAVHIAGRIRWLAEGF